MLRPLLIALALPLLAHGAPGPSTCPPVERRDGPPVHVILYGYPHGPPESAAGIAEGQGLPSLESIDDDLLLMDRFFEALGPVTKHVHGEPSPPLTERFGDVGLRAPTWRSLVQSAAAVADAIDADAATERPVVYLYLAGHGVKTGGEPGRGGGRLALFGWAEPGATEPGHDGVFHSMMLAEHVIGPLASRARLHVIADTCFSYHLLETRGMTRTKRVRRLPSEIVYDDTFSMTFPGVGAHLATRTVTYGDAGTGGRFSHALRSMASGPADLDGDGAITYGEMEHALGRIADEDGEMPPPQIVPPGLDPDAAFVDWRAAPAARICLPDAVRGRRLLADGARLFATFAAPGRPMALWLLRGHTFALDRSGWFTAWKPFTAADGPIALGAEIPRPVERSADPFPEHGVESLTLDDYAPLRPPFEPAYPWSLGLGLVGGASLSSGLAQSGRSPASAHGDLGLRVGWAGHRLLIEGGWAWWSFAGPTVTGRPTGVTGHRVGGRVGYGWLFAENGAIESEVAALYGRYRLWNAFDGPALLDVSEPVVRVTAVYPFDPTSGWAWRVQGQIGAAYAGHWMGPTIQLGIGLDFERLLY